MPHYRLYTLDRTTDHIHGAEDFEAADDASANLEVAQRMKGSPLEMWSGDRKVARFDATTGRT